jgi:NAD-dependent SIR2 family protein deacetylase
MILQVTCERCGQMLNIEHQPNDFISEKFVRNAFVCEGCKQGVKRKVVGVVEKPQASASLPYKD